MSKAQLFRVEQYGDTLILSAVYSFVSLVEEDDFRAEWDALLKLLDIHPARKMVIDLGGLDCFGAVMLQRLVVLWKRVQTAQGKLAICGVSDVGKEVLLIMKIDTLFPILGTREAALAAVGAVM